MKCPKCKGEMEEGVIGNLGGMPIAWGTKWHMGKLSLENQHKDFTVFRCKNCGYLESYAK